MSEVSKRDRQRERERRGKYNFLTVIREKINAKDNSLVFPVVLGCLESCLSSRLRFLLEKGCNFSRNFPSSAQLILSRTQE